MKAEDLKNSILQLAMEGKLVPQDSDEEPASILLNHIKKEKEKLIKEKRIKKNNKESFIYKEDGHYYERIGKKGEPICIDDELPFEIPDTWEWCRINTIREVYIGNSINKTEKETKFTGLNDGYNYIATKDVGFDNSIDYDNGVKIPEGMEKFRIAPSNSVLLCIEGGSAGRKIAILNEDVCFGNKLACFKSFYEFNQFLFYYLQSPNFKEIFKSKTTGIIGGVSIAKLRNVLMPIPPLNEQKRIVNKIEKILPLINEYGNNNELLTQLNNNFPINLKRSILQEAIQGKLVHQNTNDEPASVLLDKIKKEKEELIKSKKIKRNNKEPSIYKEDGHYYERIGKKGEPICIDDELPFEIPDTWEWCRLDNIIYNTPTKKYQIKKSEINENGPIPVISQSKIFIEGYSDKKEKMLKLDNPVLIFGDHTKNIKFIDFNFIVGADGVKILNPIIVFPKYLYYLLEYSKINMNDRGYSRHYQFLKEIFYPLPPLNEQKRIVNKIEQSFNEIEELIRSEN